MKREIAERVADKFHVQDVTVVDMRDNSLGMTKRFDEFTGGKCTVYLFCEQEK